MSLDFVPKGTAVAVHLSYHSIATAVLIDKICVSIPVMQSETYLVEVCDEEEDRYRFGFNGKEKVNEWAGLGNFQDYGFRDYDVPIARFIKVDLLFKDYPELTTYQFASNTPIQAIDLDGAEPYKINSAKDNDGRITSISIIRMYEVGKSKELNLEFTENGVTQKDRKIASFGIYNGGKVEFRDNFTHLEQLVLDYGTIIEETRKFHYYKNHDETIVSKNFEGKKLETITQTLEFGNGLYLLVNDEMELDRVLKNFNKETGYKLINAKEEFSMYNIAPQSKYKNKIYSEIKKLGIQDDQINWLEDLPNDGSKGVMKYSVGSIKNRINKREPNENKEK